MVARPNTIVDRAAASYLNGYTRAVGISIPALAELTGIPYATLAVWLREGRSIGLADFLRIVDALGLDAGETIVKIRQVAVDLTSA